MKLNEMPKIIWGNILFFVYIIVALIGGVVSRRISPEWHHMENIRSQYDLFFGVGLSSFCLIVILGLMFGKKWGRLFAISLNSILFFSTFVMSAGVYIFTKIAYDKGSFVLGIDGIVTSLLSLFFLIGLTRPKVKKTYQSMTEKSEG